ncbi:MAG: DNA primase [Thermoprotei archaeon ex4572_64]|nr:MAG: DNA primase [Thermoprotei archaeon ex4572_64]
MNFQELQKIYFKHYYKKNVPEISRIEQREIAITTFEAESIIRHLSFNSINTLQKFTVSKVPKHIYHSAAYYKYPDNPDMESKVWLGADLVFDIDADHLETEVCRDVKVMTLECLEEAVKETKKLIDILINDLGLNDKDVKIYFSGHRGFHVHVENDIVRELNQDERRELIDYILARNLNPERYVRRSIKGYVVLIRSDLQGLGRRLFSATSRFVDIKYLDSKYLKYRDVKKLSKFISDNINMIEKMLRVQIDEIVTMDTKRLIRAPNSLHGKTGLRVTRLDVKDLDKGSEYIIDKAIAFRKGMLRVRLLRDLSKIRVMGENLDSTSKDSIVKVPAYIGIYLVNTGLGEFIDEK